MRYGYIRLAKTAPSKTEQEAELRRAGLPADSAIFIDKIPTRRRTDYVDTLPQRTALIAVVAPGDVVYLASASRLGTSANDIAASLEKICSKQATVFDASAMQAIKWHPDAQSAVEFVFRGQHGLQSELTGYMRAARSQKGKTEQSEKEIETERRYHNKDIRLEDVIKFSGKSRSTLFRRYGKR